MDIGIVSMCLCSDIGMIFVYMWILESVCLYVIVEMIIMCLYVDVEIIIMCLYVYVGMISVCLYVDFRMISIRLCLDIDMVNMFIYGCWDDKCVFIC